MCLLIQACRQEYVRDALRCFEMTVLAKRDFVFRPTRRRSDSLMKERVRQEARIR